VQEWIDLSTQVQELVRLTQKLGEDGRASARARTDHNQATDAIGEVRDGGWAVTPAQGEDAVADTRHDVSLLAVDLADHRFNA
jgi:hypothetical protein